MSNGQRLNRRQFLHATAATFAAPAIIPASAMGLAGKSAPSERITLGIIGLGSRGYNLLNEFLRHADAQIVAICDVESLHYRDRQWGKGQPHGRKPAKETIERHYAGAKSGVRNKGLFVTSDYREICARKEIDALVVATPDHWHALCTLEALRAGKDVYCEKPVTHTFHEGQAVYREVAKRKAIFQTGSQQRSTANFRNAVELVLNGHIGKVRNVEVGLPPGYDKPQGDVKITIPPEQMNYDFWCGPAPALPYMRARHHRWWRGHRAYGGGVLMDWIGHHNDIAHWAIGMDRLGPTKVEAVGWTFPETGIYNTPRDYEIRCEYPGGVTSSISSRNTLGTMWIGEEGWVFVSRSRFAASDPRWTKPVFNRGPKKAYHSASHTANFLECVKSRRECIAPAEVAHRSITPGHLGYVSQTLGKPLRWDSAKERIIDNDAANDLLQKHSYRNPWVLNS